MSASMRSSVFYSQNFLKNPALVTSLLDRSSINNNDLVYEIGPGKGIITKQLARRSRQVIAIEKDPHLSGLLHQHCADISNVIVHTGDFLDHVLPRQPYKVFANIPFNITSAIVNKLTAAEYPPEEASLIMQKEAAEMFLGEPRESLRTILLKPWFEVEQVYTFQRQDFIPVPRVDVVMLRLRKRGPPLISRTERQHFRDFVVHLFSTWQPARSATFKGIFTRQQVTYLQRELEIDLHTTPTSLSCGQWLNLFAYFRKVGSEQVMRRIAGSEAGLIRQQNRLPKIHRTRST